MPTSKAQINKIVDQVPNALETPTHYSTQLTLIVQVEPEPLVILAWFETRQME